MATEGNCSRSEQATRIRRMLEIYPAIDLRGGQCVRLQQGDYDRETVFGDDPAAMAARWVSQGARQLHLVDLDGAKAGHPQNLDAVRSILDAVDVPCQLGGGVRSEDTVVELLDLGLARVIVGTQALKEPAWFAGLAEAHPHRLVLGLDARNGWVATEGWLETSKTRASDLALQFRGVPLAAVVFTNIANDGMMAGVDDDTLTDMVHLAATTDLPVIASGGVSRLQDVRNLAALHDRQPNLVGAIVGRALYDGMFDVSDAIAAAEGG